MRVCLGGHPNTRFSGHGEVKFAPFLLREGGLRGCQKSEIGRGRLGGRGVKEGLPQPLPQRTHYSVMGLGGWPSSFQTFVCPHLVDSRAYIYERGIPPTRAGTSSNNISPKPLPPQMPCLFQHPPPPITRKHAEGGRERLLVSPLPTPAVSRDRHCCVRVGEKRKRKIGGGEPQKTILMKKSGPIFFTGN